MLKIRFIVCPFVWLVVGSSLALASSALNLRVVWSEDPQTAAVVVWDGEAISENAVLLYDTVSRAQGRRAYAFQAELTEAGLYQESPGKKPKNAEADWTPPAASLAFYYHHAPLTGLQPGTVYYLAVKTAQSIGLEFHFKTAPDDGAAFKLVYGGDSRSDISVARQVSEQMGMMVEDDDSIIGLIHGGDYAVSPRRDVWREWLEAYYLTTTVGGKLLPIIPVVGNHDVGGGSPIFRQAYGYPGGTDDYYACRLTPAVGILCLNTEISAEGNQRAFLRKSLAQFEADQVKWQIAAFHKPAYPGVKKPSAAKVSWVPLFEEYNIDLALESDGHCIKRTVPIRGDAESADGIVYIGEGGYGAPQRQPKADRWYLQGENAFASKGDHVMILEVEGDLIHYSALLSSGEIVDSASFQARR